MRNRRRPYPFGRPVADRRSFTNRAGVATGLVLGAFAIAAAGPVLVPLFAATAAVVLGISSLSALDTRTA